MRKISSEQLKREIKAIRKVNKVKKKISYRRNRSRLDKYKGEIMRLHQIEEATYKEIKDWLRKHKRIVVCRSTISRRVEKWLNGER